MNKQQHLEKLQRPKKDHPYDGVITEVNETFVHVRLAGAARRIIHNVIIADHIIARKEVLYRGLPCKVAKLFDRESQGRWILTDILPNITYGDYAGAGTGIPDTPRISVQADCDTSTWSITWTPVDCTYYELYWAADESGTGATLIQQTNFRGYSLAFDTSTPPKRFFAVRAVHGLFDGELSPWTTDPVMFTGGALVIFGDDENHGHVTPTSLTRWKCFDGQVLKSTDNGGSWTDVTPDAPDNDFTQTPAPTAATISYIQVFGDDNKIFVLGTYDDLTIKGGWIFWTDDEGLTWVDKPATGMAAPLQIVPIWGAYNDTYVTLVVWTETSLASEELHYIIYDNDATLTDYEYDTLVLTSYADVVARAAYAFPVAVTDNDDIFFFAGLINGFLDVGVIDNIFYYDLTDDYYAVEQGWGTDWCSSLIVGPDDAGSRPMWFTREVAL